MAGIYIHIPFCKRLCRYCDFYSSMSLGLKDRMLAALEREMDLKKDYPGSEKITTLYFGGGTPSLLTSGEIARLVNKVKTTWGVESFEEVTLEANPDDLTETYLDSLRETAIDRLSIGIQSFEDEHLALFNRRHNAAEASEAVLRAKRYGYRNLTVDLIYGIPGMTAGQWERNLKKFGELDVPHLSAYHLTIEQGTIFGKMASRGELQPVPEAASAEHYSILEKFMRDAGYEHYEVSNFARPGFEARHNSLYWSGVLYVGIGPSAHSYNGRSRQWNIASNVNYLNRLETGSYFETEILSETDMYNEYVMTSLRTSRGIDLKSAGKRFGAVKLNYLTTETRPMIEKGLLAEANGRIWICPENFLLSDFIIGKLFLR